MNQSNLTEFEKEEWRWGLCVAQTGGFDEAPLRIGSGIYQRSDVAELVHQVFEIAVHGTTPDGDHVNVSTQMWAEGWARKLRAER